MLGAVYFAIKLLQQESNKMFFRMLFRVKACGSGEELILEVEPQQETTKYIKKSVHLWKGVPSHDQALICRGHALEDDIVPLISLSKYISEFDTIWFTVCKSPRTDEDIQDERFPIDAMRSIFSLQADYEPSDLQNADKCISVFLEFCRFYSRPPVTEKDQAFKTNHDLSFKLTQENCKSEWEGAHESEITIRNQFTWQPTNTEECALRCSVAVWGCIECRLSTDILAQRRSTSRGPVPRRDPALGDDGPARIVPGQRDECIGGAVWRTVPGGSVDAQGMQYNGSRA